VDPVYLEPQITTGAGAYEVPEPIDPKLSSRADKDPD